MDSLGVIFFTGVILVLGFLPKQGSCKMNINVSFGDLSQVILFERQQTTFNVCVLAYDELESVSLTFESDNSYTFEVINGSSLRYTVSPVDTFPATFPITIKGKHIGISGLLVMATAVGYDTGELVGSLVVKINIGNSIIQGILRYFFYVPLMCVFFVMGTTMDLQAIAECFRRPWAIFIGFVCQFVLMPALAFGIGRVLRLETAYALGLLLMGCSPGGKISNDLTILLDADYVLSVTMTACSTTLALAMMPLNVFIYTRFIIDASVVTPFGQIAMQIAILVSPIFLGLLLKYKFPKVKDLAVKILKPFVAIVMLIGVGIIVPFNWYIFLSPWQVYVAAFLLPLCGGLFGGGIAKGLRLKNKQVIAISMETGVQNGLFASVVLQAIYPYPEASLALSCPMLVFLSMVVIGLILVIIKTLLSRFVWKDDEDTKDILDDEANDEGVKDASVSDGVILKSINACTSDLEEVNEENQEG